MSLKKLMKGENAWDSEKQDFAVALRYPLYISPKIDGYRGSVQDAKLWSYSGKPFQNSVVNDFLGRSILESLDFEVTDGEPTDKDVFSRSSSSLRKEGAQPHILVHVFDDFSNPGLSYEERLNELHSRTELINVDYLRDFGYAPFRVVEQRLVNNEDELIEAETEYLLAGYEGAMTRSPTMPYKNGRATLLQQHLLKLKRFSHTEAIIIGYEEEMENTNEAELDVFGKTVRRNTKDAKAGKGRLGKYICIAVGYDKPFRVSATTMPHADRLARWATIDNDIGDLIRFKHLKHGEVDGPRHPMYAGHRLEIDVEPSKLAALREVEKAYYSTL